MRFKEVVVRGQVGYTAPRFYSLIRERVKARMKGL